MVEFSKVTFTYKGAAAPALKEVAFEVPEGTTLGIVGRSGSGKTTVTRLLQRLHSNYDGLIKIGGVDVREYDVDHLRRSLGVVLQESFLFSGTIRENIMVAKSDATFDEVVRAARMAGAEEFIDKLPRGYDTYVFEGSPNLSGGQRQRLAIARALIVDPRDSHFRRSNQRTRSRKRSDRDQQSCPHRARPDADRHFSPVVIAGRVRCDLGAWSAAASPMSAATKNCSSAAISIASFGTSKIRHLAAPAAARRKPSARRAQPCLVILRH